MEWFNQPPDWQERDGRIEATTAPNSDFWRKTHYGFIRDNGHFYYQEVTGDFEAEVVVSGNYHSMYDQAGLMLRVDDENWIKTGIEYFDGKQHASAVITRDFSDWSIVRFEEAQPRLWLRVTRKAEAVNVYYSTTGSDFFLLRSGYLLPSAACLVGPMCASPEGSGFKAVFEHYQVRTL